MALAVAAFLVTQHLRGAVSGPDGADVPFVDPDAWDGRAHVAVAALLGGAVVAVLARRSGWTAPLLAANVISNVVVASVALWLAASGAFVNAAFFEAIDASAPWRNTAELTGWVLAAIVVVAAVVDAVEPAVRWRRRVQPGARSTALSSTLC